MTKVLIIEDEDIVARMYEKALSFDGYTVVTAIGGHEGLDKVQNDTPDIVLLDIMMPSPNGMEILEEIREDPKTRDLPVVMLTNLSGKHDVDLALSRGADDYWIKKDIMPKDLGKRIEEVLAKKKTDVRPAEVGNL